MDSAVNTILSPDAWVGFVLVIVAVLLLFNLVAQAVGNLRDLRKPNADEAAKLEELRSDVVKKVALHDTQIDDLRLASQLQMRALMALLNHELHNGNSDEMDGVQRDIQTYLLRR